MDAPWIHYLLAVNEKSETESSNCQSLVGANLKVGAKIPQLGGTKRGNITLIH